MTAVQTLEKSFNALKAAQARHADAVSKAADNGSEAHHNRVLAENGRDARLTAAAAKSLGHVPREVPSVEQIAGWDETAAGCEAAQPEFDRRVIHWRGRAETEQKAHDLALNAHMLNLRSAAIVEWQNAMDAVRQVIERLIGVDDQIMHLGVERRPTDQLIVLGGVAGWFADQLQHLKWPAFPYDYDLTGLSSTQAYSGRRATCQVSQSSRLGCRQPSTRRHPHERWI